MTLGGFHLTLMSGHSAPPGSWATERASRKRNVEVNLEVNERLLSFGCCLTPASNRTQIPPRPAGAILFLTLLRYHGVGSTLNICYSQRLHVAIHTHTVAHTSLHKRHVSISKSRVH